MEPRTKVKYIARERSLVDNKLIEAGQEVMYDGLPAENLEPTCDEGQARYREYLDSNSARVAQMIEQNRPPEALDPAAFAAAVSRAVAEANAAADARMAELVEKMQAGMAAAIGQALGQALNAPPAAAPAAPAAKTAKAKGDSTDLA